MNPRKVKIFTVYLLAFLTGVNFVVFPALAPVFTDESLFGLSTSQFGNLFIPQVIFITVSCLVTPFLVNKFGPKIILSSGVLLMMLSTVILWLLQFFLNDKAFLFSILLILVAMTGFGFGLSITTLNPLAASLFDDSKTSAILVLQFLVGLGTSTSPLMMGLISDIKDWVFIPAGIFVAVLISFILLIFIKLESGTIFQLPKQFRIPSKLWLFFITIVFYGLLEGTFGGFGSVILKNIGLDNSSASIGLSLFWGGIAINRLLFGIFSKQFNLSVIFLISPLLIGVLLWLLMSSSSASIVLSLMFTIGFFMGSLFPGSIGWATVEFPQFAVLVSGSMMAANQIGTGIMTNTLGSFQNNSDLFSEILKYLSFIPIIIFALLMFLRKDSKIKEAF